jgi:hypothetical protein
MATCTEEEEEEEEGGGYKTRRSSGWPDQGRDWSQVDSGELAHPSYVEPVQTADCRRGRKTM